MIKSQAEQSAGAALRLGRAVVFGGSTLLLTLAAHVTGAGCLPSPMALTVLSVLCVAGHATLVGGRLSPAQILAMLGVGQMLLHGAMALAEGASPPSGVHHGAGHLASTVGSTAGYDPIRILSTELTSISLPMTIGHLAVIALAGSWLGAAERLFWQTRALLADAAGQLVRAAHRAAAWLLTSLAPRSATAPRVPSHWGGPVPWSRTVARLLAGGGAVRRGPPAGVA